jgi:hypothetical protein
MIENIIQTPDGYRATIDGVEWTIPDDMANRMRRMVQDAIDLGAEVTIEEPPATPVPNLSFAQLLYGLVTEEFITEQEANDWLVNRILPEPIETLISQLTGPQQILARARALQPTEIVFSDPMVQALGGDEQFFRTYAEV